MQPGSNRWIRERERGRERHHKQTREKRRKNNSITEHVLLGMRRCEISWRQVSTTRWNALE
jgi:hypothetical protein